jgi:hypothetical protein
VLNATSVNLTGATTLNISELNGFVPTVGSTFKILNFGSETGTFMNVIGQQINSTEYYAVTYQATDVLLTVDSGTAPTSRQLTDTLVIGSRGGLEDGARLAATVGEFNAATAAARDRVDARIAALSMRDVRKSALADLIKQHR